MNKGRNTVNGGQNTINEIRMSVNGGGNIMDGGKILSIEGTECIGIEEKYL